MEIWVNKVGGKSDSEFKVKVIDGIRDINDLRKAINESVECAKAPEWFGFGAVDIYTDASATAEFKLSARDTLLVDGQLKWDSLFFSQPAQSAQQGASAAGAEAAVVGQKRSSDEMHSGGIPERDMSSVVNACKGQFAGSFETVLKKPLPFPVPVFSRMHLGEGFERADSSVTSAVDIFLKHSLVSSGNETAVLGLDVTSWMSILRDLVDGCYVFCNQHHSSSKALLRPDGVVEVNGCVVTIVESKGVVTQGVVARSELTDKLHPLAYKKFPVGCLSIVGITTTDAEINLYSLSYNPITRMYSSALLKRYTVTELEGRRAFILDVFKLVCWMLTVRSSGSMSHLIPGVRVRTPNGHFITWNRAGLFKEFKQGSVPNMDLIRRLYQADLANVERGTANCTSVTITSIGTRLTDAVRNGAVTSKADVVRQVRAAVEQIHSAGVAHCDICVENLFVLDSGVILLGDLEYCTDLESAQLPEVRRMYVDRESGQAPTTAMELDANQLARLEEFLHLELPGLV